MHSANNKKGISELVSYVLLISLAIIMAGLVFAYLRFYAQNPLPKQSCPEVSLIIDNYSCMNGTLNMTVKNQGRFDVDGFTVKINNGTALYSLNYKNSMYVLSAIGPGAILLREFDYSKYNGIRNIEIEAFRGKDKAGNPVLCENSVVKQEVENC